MSEGPGGALALLSLSVRLLGGLLALAAAAWGAGWLAWWLAWGRRRGGSPLHPFVACIGLSLLAQGCLWLAAAGRLRPASLLLLGALVAAAATPGVLQAVRALRPFAGAARGAPWWPATVAGGSLLALLSPLAIAMLPPHAWDEITYHLGHARALAATGSLSFVSELRVPVFPQLWESLAASLLLAGGELAPHLVSLLATALTAGLVFAWGREAGGSAAGWLAVGLLLGSPLVVYLAGVGYVDPLLALFSTGAAYATWRARECVQPAETNVVTWMAAAGWLAGCAAATKYLGLYLLPALALSILGLPRGFRWRAAGAFLLAASAAAGLTFLWIAGATGNPLFPFFGSLFGHSPWAPPALESRAWSAGLQSIVALPWNAVFARERAGLQPPLSPLYLLTPLLLWRLRDRTVRWLLTVASGTLAVLLAVPLLDVRYLAMALPLLSIALALGALRRDPAGGAAMRPAPFAALVAMVLALPGLLYGPFYLWRAGGVPLSATQRERFLAAQVTGYRTLRWLAAQPAANPAVYGLHTETLHGLAGEVRLRGEIGGPWRYSHVEPLLADPRRLFCVLRSLDSTHLLVPRRLVDRVARDQPALVAPARVDGDAVLFALAPGAAAYSSTCMPSSTTRLGGR